MTQFQLIAFVGRRLQRIRFQPSEANQFLQVVSDRLVSPTLSSTPTPTPTPTPGGSLIRGAVRQSFELNFPPLNFEFSPSAGGFQDYFPLLGFEAPILDNPRSHIRLTFSGFFWADVPTYCVLSWFSFDFNLGTASDLNNYLDGIVKFRGRGLNEADFIPIRFEFTDLYPQGTEPYYRFMLNNQGGNLHLSALNSSFEAYFPTYFKIEEIVQ